MTISDNNGMFVHSHSQRNDTLLGNGVIGILAETVNMWERRAPLTPSHCARLVLGGGKRESGVNRIIVQPSTKRIHHDAQYEDAGCEISEDLSECGLIVGIKQPKVTLQPVTLDKDTPIDFDLQFATVSRL